MAQIVGLVTQIGCNSITKKQEETLNVRVNCNYQGPEIRGRLGAVVTQETLLQEFDEIGSTRKEVYVDLSPSDEPEPIYTNIPGMPLAGCEPKSGYGIKVYALDIDGKPEWGCKNVLTVQPKVFGEVEITGMTVNGKPGTRTDGDFQGTKIPKVSSESIKVDIKFTYRGASQTLEIQTDTGKMGAFGGYDSESKQFYDSKQVVTSDTPREYTLSRTIPLSFWGDRQIDDCAVRVVIKGEGIEIESVLWDAYTVNIEEIGLELLEVKIDPVGAGTVTVTPEPEKGTQHNWYFPSGTTVYVTAHPDPGYVFKSWSGAMTDTTAITAPVYSMTQERKITAHFEKEVVGPPKAKIDNVDFVAVKGEYSIGDSVPFTCWYDYEGREQGGQLLLELGTGVAPWFTPVARYAPMKITLEEAMRATRRSFPGYFQLTEALKPGQLYNTRAVLKAVEEYTEDMATDWSVIRITEVALQYTLTAIASPSYGGSVSGAGKYSAGANATLYATPASGYEFSYWGGDASGTSRSTSVYMDRNKSVTAYFKKVVKEYTLTTSVYPPGAGSVTGAGTYRSGIYATLYATPASGYEFERWSGDASGISRSVRVYMDRDKRAVANFKKKVVPGFTLTVLMSPTSAAGWVRKEPDKPSYTYGETVKLTATSAAGYRFSYWTVNGERAGYSSTLTLMVTTDLEVIAYYTKV